MAAPAQYFRPDRGDCAAAGTVAQPRHRRLGSRTPVLVLAQYRADADRAAADLVDRPAATEIPDLRGDLERHRPQRLPRHGRTAARRRLLAVRVRADQFLRLRLLPDLATLAGGRVLRAAGLRHRVAADTQRAVQAGFGDLFLYRAADPVGAVSARLSAARPVLCFDLAVGRHPGQRRGGLGRHRILAAAGRDPGARGAARKCRSCGCFR